MPPEREAFQLSTPARKPFGILLTGASSGKIHGFRNEVNPHVKPTDIVNFERIIGKPRLQSYRTYFKTNSPEATIGLYMWNGEVSSCFAALLSYFEICLRNNIHIAMANHYLGDVSSGSHWWDVIATQLVNRTMEKIRAIRDKNGMPRVPAPTADEIVSHVTFGFWSTVLGRIDKRHAHLIMPAIFPHHPLNAHPMDWKDNDKRKKAISFVFEVNDFSTHYLTRQPHHTTYTGISSCWSNAMSRSRYAGPKARGPSSRTDLRCGCFKAEGAAQRTTPYLISNSTFPNPSIAPRTIPGPVAR